MCTGVYVYTSINTSVCSHLCSETKREFMLMSPSPVACSVVHSCLLSCLSVNVTAAEREPAPHRPPTQVTVPFWCHVQWCPHGKQPYQREYSASGRGLLSFNLADYLVSRGTWVSPRISQEPSPLFQPRRQCSAPHL